MAASARSAFSTTALLGALLLFLFVGYYPKFWTYMTSIFFPTYWVYALLFFAEKAKVATWVMVKGKVASAFLSLISFSRSRRRLATRRIRTW